MDNLSLEKRTLKGQVAACTKLNSLQEWTEIKALGGKCEIGIKISAVTLDPSYCRFSSIQCVCMRSLIQLLTDHTPQCKFVAS